MNRRTRRMRSTVFHFWKGSRDAASSFVVKMRSLVNDGPPIPRLVNEPALAGEIVPIGLGIEREVHLLEIALKRANLGVVHTIDFERAHLFRHVFAAA